MVCNGMGWNYRKGYIDTIVKKCPLFSGITTFIAF